MRYFIFCFIILTSFKAIGQSFNIVEDFKSQSKLENVTGVSVADYDQDGDLDAYIVAAEIFDINDSLTWSRLLRNDGSAGFIDVTLTSNLINFQAETRMGAMGSKMGASWGDYDNDGYPDIFISNYGLDELWHNEGDGTFTNVTLDANVGGCFLCYSTNAVWWDYDVDGDLDLYVSDWMTNNRFFRNDGNNVFSDISEQTGLNDRRHTFSSLPIDLNSDGLLDLYIVNDVGENRFFWNKGNDVFEEATAKVGLSNNGNGMGVDVSDFNNDGLFDIYVTNIYEYDPNPFFVNRGGVYNDRATHFGVDNTGWGWGARFFDADHDLDEDLYVVNGFSSPVADGDRNKFFINTDQGFIDQASIHGVNSVERGMGLEVFDYDLDGDLDILVGNTEAPVGLYHNNLVETEGNSNWIQILLQGTSCNRDGFGAVVSITCDGVDYYRYHSGVNLFGQSIKPVHFGLGGHNQVDKTLVKWPDGLNEVFGVSLSNQIITLIQGEGEELKQEIILGVPSDTSKGIKIYPNPFEDELSINMDFKFLGKFKIELIDVMGKVVFHDEFTIRDGSNTARQIVINQVIPGGLYSYTVKGQGLYYTGKVIKK